MKKIFYGLIFCFFISCQKEDVQLPLSDIIVMSEITDHSPVYMFYNEKDTSAIVVNTKNTITTTNWIFNIDKRLKLEKVIPLVKELQLKKKQSVHAKEGMLNLYSYADSTKKALAFIPFTDVNYRFDKYFSKFFIKEHGDAYKSYLNITVNFNKDNLLTVDGNEVERKDLVAFIKDFSDFMGEGKQTIVHLNFDKHLTYGEYLQNKILAWQMTSETIMLSSYEFVYDQEKLPQCNCKL